MIAVPSPALALPFLGLLLTIAVAPSLAPSFWHRHYGKCVAFWTAAYLLPEAALQGGGAATAAALNPLLQEYLPFVLLLGALFTVAGGLRVTGAPRGGPAVNTVMLALGTVLASLIGTTGAAMMMIRPILRANRHRRQATHIIVFFILLVANVGGALTPLGDPPLLLGYLAGVPFLWPLQHLWGPTLLMAAGLLASFYALDSYIYHRRRSGEPAVVPEIEKLGLEGGVNLALLVAIVAILLGRALWRPEAVITVLATRWSVADATADLLLLAVGLLSLLLTPSGIRAANEFRWGPIVEVAILFAGIFIAIEPVTALVAAGGAGPAAPLFHKLFVGGAPDNSWFFWGTGLLSAVLDNAPTYLVFFAAAGGQVSQLTDGYAVTLAAISAGAVYFGALTYVGNAPNLMVKALAESHGVRMPGFFGYVGWAALCLLPWLLLVERLFFAR